MGTCPNGHEVREGLAFCTTCGTALLSTSFEEASETTDPAADATSSGTEGGPRRWLAVGALVGVAALVGGIWIFTSGRSNRSDGNEARFVAAVRQASPDTADTLSDAEILDTGRANCEMAREGTLASNIAKAEREVVGLDVAPGVITKTMTLPLKYLCPQYSLPTTTSPPQSTTTSAVTTMATTTTIPGGGIDSQGRLIIGADRIGPVRFGATPDQVSEGLSSILGGAPTITSNTDAACVGKGIEDIRWDSLITETTGNDGLQYFTTQGPNFVTRDGIAIGSPETDIQARLHVSHDPGEDPIYGPQYQVTDGPDKGLYIEVSGGKVTSFFASQGHGLDCQSANGE